MPTLTDTPCPTCPSKSQGTTEFVALVKNEKTGLEPHKYSVCVLCYRKQFAVAYPGDTCPI